MFGDEQNAELREFIAPRARQAQAVAASLGCFVRAGDKIERQAEVIDRARHRADHRKIDRLRARRASQAEHDRGRATIPCVGLCAQMPQKWAGTRKEPPISEPSDKGPKPAASAADDPPDEPPGVRVLSHGLWVAP